MTLSGAYFISPEGTFPGSRLRIARNEFLHGLDQTDKRLPALVLVDGESFEGPFYVPESFTHEPDWALAGIRLDLARLLAQTEPPS